MDGKRVALISKGRSVLLYGFAAVGVVSMLLFMGGLIVDYRNFDRTSGGYDPPYSDYGGDPIDWSKAHTTSSGMLRTGYVLNTYVDCMTGMISLEVYGRRFDYRELSPRALAVHQPREACEKRGFEPDF